MSRKRAGMKCVKTSMTMAESYLGQLVGRSLGEGGWVVGRGWWVIVRAMATVATAAPASRRIVRERTFFTAIAIALAAAVFVGFAPTWFLKPLFATTPA